MIDLEDLGPRICIIGPSSSGKSTLGKALSDKLGIRVFHLDQLAHIPQTNWQLRDRKLLAADHRTILQSQSQWIIEGNYSFLMTERFSLATSVIWLDFGVPGSLYRYLKRSWKNSANRPRNLAGATNEISLRQILQILLLPRKNRPKYLKLTRESNCLVIRLRAFSELRHYYAHWNLSHP